MAYVDPDGREDYNAKTWIGEVEEGAFTVAVARHQSGPHELCLIVLHLNGAVSEVPRWCYDAGRDSEVDATTLSAAWALHRAEQAFMRGDTATASELAVQLLEAGPDASVAAKLQHLLSLIMPGEPVVLATVVTNEISPSDTLWDRATVGWGKPARNQYYPGGTIQDAVFLQLGDQFFPKGLYAHAPSRYAFDLDGVWKELEATVGLQAGAGNMARPVFTVKGDGRILYQSKPLEGRNTATIAVSVAGVRELELIVESAIEGNARCWSIWGDARVKR
jgi:hypothetical protein